LRQNQGGNAIEGGHYLCLAFYCNLLGQCTHFAKANSILLASMLGTAQPQLDSPFKSITLLAMNNPSAFIKTTFQLISYSSFLTMNYQIDRKVFPIKGNHFSYAGTNDSFVRKSLCLPIYNFLSQKIISFETISFGKI
jgi:hypothetical protein